MIRPSISSTVEALHRALTSAEVKPHELAAVLLAGGSSRIPVVARMVEAAVRRPTVVDAHPKHVVALGAARLAAARPIPPGAGARDRAGRPPPRAPSRCGSDRELETGTAHHPDLTRTVMAAMSATGEPPVDPVPGIIAPGSPSGGG
jgi:hypothetical protein